MTTKRIIQLIVAMGLFFISTASAQVHNPENIVIRDKNGNVIYDSRNSSLTPAEALTNAEAGTALAPEEIEANKRESLFPEQNQSLSRSHFTWGAEFGSSIDCTSYDLTTFDIDAFLGFKNSFIKLLGVGAGIHKTVTGGTTFIPVYVTLRTSFRKKPSPFFLHMQGGYSFNTISNSEQFGDYMASLGLGINLSQRRLAKSYIILAAGYHYFDEGHRKIANLENNNLFTAKLTLGVNF